MAGGDKMKFLKDKIDYLIVDEACQCIEPSALIPFCLNPERVILVGDQKQLPATIFSKNARDTGYARSLFERLIDNGYPKVMLSI